MGSWQNHRPVPNNITKKVVKGQGTKPCPQHFLPHFLTKKIIFSITWLQGGPHNWGYLCPQNEWKVSNTITLSPTSLQRRQNMG
jgi:hypothetical protein